MVNYKCPGRKLDGLLDALDINRFRELSETDNYGLRDIVERLGKGFPNWSKGRLTQLAKIAKAEYLRNRQIYLELKKYGDRLIDISDGLGGHVENCRKPEGCFDRYMVWLERNARAVVKKKGFSENHLPGIIRQLDLKTLDLIV